MSSRKSLAYKEFGCNAKIRAPVGKKGRRRYYTFENEYTHIERAATKGRKVM